jgi:hypothetical protein
MPNQYLKSACQGLVIDINNEGGVRSGSPLQALVQKSEVNQWWTWESVPAEVPPTSLYWGESGSGPPWWDPPFQVSDEPSNFSTVCSGGNTCAYQVSLLINQDGSCTFQGLYQNRGDVFWGTAPNQNYSIGFVVSGGSGQGYAFTQSGNVPSAPQSGSLITFNTTQNCDVIAENWYPIVANNFAHCGCSNSWSESPFTVIGQLVGSLASDIETAVSDVEDVIEIVGEVVAVVGAAVEPVSVGPPAGVTISTVAPPRPPKAPEGIQGSATVTSGPISGTAEQAASS